MTIKELESDTSSSIIEPWYKIILPMIFGKKITKIEGEIGAAGYLYKGDMYLTEIYEVKYI